MKNLDPPPPISKTEKWHVFALRAASSLIWGEGGGGVGADGGLLFNSILSKIVALWLFKLVQRNESWYYLVRIVSLFPFIVVVFLLAASDCETP